MANQQAFPCPDPGCTRSFPELWKLRAHYRAPIRNAPGRGGHGTELPSCPRCREELQPLLPHLGCTGGLAAPKQAAKRRRQHDLQEEDRRLRQATSVELSPNFMGALSLDRAASSSIATSVDFGGCLGGLPTPPQAASPTGSNSIGMVAPMSMGSYEGMPARSDPRRKPLEHLVSAFLQAVMRVQRKQQQGLPEHLTAAQYDSESSGGCKTPPRRVQQQQQQLQWDARGCGVAPAKMAESAANGSPLRVKRSVSNSSAEDTTALLGGATGSSEWTAETLLQQCRDVATQPGVSGDGHAEVVGAMMSALNGLQQQPGQQQQLQQQGSSVTWSEQQPQPFGQPRGGPRDQRPAPGTAVPPQGTLQRGPSGSLQQQALARDADAMLAGWHAEQAAAGRGFERQRSGSAPLPAGAGRWWQQDGLRAGWAPLPRPPQPLHCSGGILDSSLGGHWQLQQEQGLAPGAAAGAAAEPALNFIADFASMPSVPLLAHTDPLWEVLQQHDGSVTIEAPPPQLAASQPPMQQPAASCQPEGAPGPISTTGWAVTAPGPDAHHSWALPDHIVPQQPPRPTGGGNSWAAGSIEASGPGPLYPSMLPPSLTPPGSGFTTGPGGSCGDLTQLQDASAPWQHHPTEMYGNAMTQPPQEVL